MTAVMASAGAEPGRRPAGLFHRMAALLRRRNAGAASAPCRTCRAIAAAAALAVPLIALLIDPYFVDMHRMLVPVAAFEMFINPFGRSVWYLVPLGVALIASGLLAWQTMRGRRLALWSMRVQAAWFFFLSIGATEIASSLLKQAFGRARPIYADTLGPYVFDPWTFTYGFASFPSGHAATFGALFACIACLTPRAWPVWTTLALACGFSRVVVGVHWPSDVVAGVAFGAIMSVAVAHMMARRRLLFRVDGNGVLTCPVLRRRA